MWWGLNTFWECVGVWCAVDGDDGKATWASLEDGGWSDVQCHMHVASAFTRE